VISFYNDKDKYELFSQNAILNSQRFDLSEVSELWEKLFINLFSEKETKIIDTPLKSSFKTPKVSIVMPVYNRENNLFYCLDALTKQSFKDFEVIITDDGSTDNTKKVVDKFRNKLNIRYTYAGENKGFRAARARNIGLQKVRGELVIFLDSDIVTPKNYIEEHIKVHKKYDEIVVNSFVYRMKTYKEDDLGLEPFEFIKKHRENLNDDIKYEFHVFDKEEPIEEGYYLDSNSLSIKAKHIIDEGFDESFVGWGHEDTELGYRFISKNFKFLFIKNNCESYHIHHYISPQKDDETAVNWKRLTTKYNINRWYDPKPSIIVECPIRIKGWDCEKGKTLTDIIDARLEIKRGDKIEGFFPLFEFDISKWQ
ncbi:MAG: glycosyltransferase, partial [Candidatus Sericytochromatia bacterium]